MEFLHKTLLKILNPLIFEYYLYLLAIKSIWKIKNDYIFELYYSDSDFFLGLIGNSTGLIVFIRISSKIFPTRIIFIIYALINLLCLFYLFTKFLIKNIFSVLFYDISVSLCKIGYFLDYFLLSVANYVLVFISMERFLSIKFSKLNTFKKKLNQFISIFIIVTYNFLLYTPSIYFLSFVNKTNSTECDFIKNEYNNLMSLMEFINSSLVPFVIMLIFSGLLIQTVLKSR